LAIYILNQKRELAKTDIGEFQWPPLLLAALNDDPSLSLSLSHRLILKGADVNATSKMDCGPYLKGTSPLELAAKNSNLKLACWLQLKGALPNDHSIKARQVIDKVTLFFCAFKNRLPIEVLQPIASGLLAAEQEEPKTS
jgi:hypothetical protein